MKNNILLFLFFIFHLYNIGLSQSKEQVYLKKIQQANSDTTKINFYIQLIDELYETETKKAIRYAFETEKLSQKTNFKPCLIHDKLAGLHILISDYKKATDYALIASKEAQKLTGSLKHDYEGKAFEKLAKINNVNGAYDLAIEYQMQAIEAYKKIKGDNYYIISYINLANYFIDQGKYESALYYYRFVEENLEKENFTEYYPYVYNGMAVCFTKQKKPEKAIEYYEKSKQAVLKYTPDDVSSLATAFNNIGDLQNEIGQYNSAVFNLSEALELFKKIDEKYSVANVYYNLSLAYTNLEMYEESNENMMNYVMLNDSIMSEENRQTIHDLSIKYESEKKEQQNKILAKDNEKKQLSIYFSLAGLLLVLVILVIIFRNNRIKARINKKLEEQNHLIEEQKAVVVEQHELLEEKNTEITDSIKYAKRIQGAILPPEQKWNTILPGSFVLNKPKDILSGDFYWIAESEEHIFVAAADCTGHGVPGALISIVNFNLLNKAVLERGLERPSEILDAVNTWLNESLNQASDESTIKDGMDIALISIHKKTGQILYSGANNPLYVFHGDELIEYKSDKFPVGAFLNENPQRFSTKEITVSAGDHIYLFSDGFADQFGGPEGKKYKYKQFKEILLAASKLPVQQQKDFLSEAHSNWCGSLEQTDDVLVIGMKL
ncbi:MAG: tetratricopeptide repeat protein [Bacteroidota bacterium]